MFFAVCKLAMKHNQELKMSSLQRLTIESFVKKVGQKTYNDYSKMTGIERTRLFRLFQGAEMKVHEFEVFQSFINGEKGSVRSFAEDVRLHDDLSQYSDDLRTQVIRDKRLKEYLEQSKAA
jgi:hypothetical protein